MKKYLNISMIALLGMFLLSACKKDATGLGEEEERETYKISITKSAANNQEWQLQIDAVPANQAGVWIDLNNNGTKDNGEAVREFGVYIRYPLSSKTITVHGKAYGFSCAGNGLTSIDVSGNTHLSYLYCSINSLTQLDVSKNPELTILGCNGNDITALDFSSNKKLHAVEVYQNKISTENMKKLFNSMPVRPADNKGIFRLLYYFNEGNSRPASAELDACKAKNWVIYEANTSGGWDKL